MCICTRTTVCPPNVLYLYKCVHWLGRQLWDSTILLLQYIIPCCTVLHCAILPCTLPITMKGYNCFTKFASPRVFTWVNTLRQREGWEASTLLFTWIHFTLFFPNPFWYGAVVCWAAAGPIWWVAIFCAFPFSLGALKTEVVHCGCTCRNFFKNTVAVPHSPSATSCVSAYQLCGYVWTPRHCKKNLSEGGTKLRQGVRFYLSSRKMPLPLTCALSHFSLNQPTLLWYPFVPALVPCTSHYKHNSHMHRRSEYIIKTQRKHTCATSSHLQSWSPALGRPLCSVKSVKWKQTSKIREN